MSTSRTETELLEISVPDAELDDLRRRLRETRWSTPLKGIGAERGVQPEALGSLVAYWADGFDWRGVEAGINDGTNHVATIDGARIHYRHVRSVHREAATLVLTHGWPGAFTDFSRLIPRLVDPTAHGGRPEDAFHVVVPSLPGYGLSTPLTDAGWDIARIARAWATLMASLGYDRYVAHGADAGSPISLALGLLDAEHVDGVHVGMLITVPGPDDVEALDAADRERLDRTQRFLANQSAYMQLMATRPATLAYALDDSPAGLLAWILERYQEWSDPRSLPEGRVTPDDILTVATLYWLTRSALSTANFYYEGAQETQALLSGAPTPTPPVPVGVSVFPHDCFLPQRAVAERQYKIVDWADHDEGGHFAALETPDLLAADLRRFAGLLRAEGERPS